MGTKRREQRTNSGDKIKERREKRGENIMWTTREKIREMR